MITKNFNITTRTLLSALFFILLSAGLLTSCQTGDKRDPTMDGFLIKDRQTTAMMKDQKVWFSEIKTKDPTMASVLDSVARQDWSKTKKGEQPKTLSVGEIVEALRNGQIFDQFE